MYLLNKILEVKEIKQAEKSKLTYNKILKGAIKEFGVKSYNNGSINNICNNNNISKGLIYHNFKNKDDLYLSAVKECFEKITNYLSNGDYSADDFNENIKKLLDLRIRFFCENPCYSNIFFNAVLHPPKHLIRQIKELRSKFDEFNSMQFKKLISTLALRDGISSKEALEYFYDFQDMINGYFASKTYESDDLSSLIQDHEIKLSKILNIMLYGLAKEKKTYVTTNC